MNQNAIQGKLAVMSFRKIASVLTVSLIVSIIAAGCSSTEVTSRERLVNEKLQRPAKIVVYNFVANPADVPGDSALAVNSGEKTPALNADAIKSGNELGSGIATQLVQQIRDMGLPAEKAAPQTKLQINDIVLRGYLVSVMQGDAAKRVVVGFGYGASELETVVEGYQVTKQGLRKLGSGKVKSVGNKTPGGALGAVSMIANANPAGLIIGGAVKGYGEISGNSKVDGLAKSTAKVIAEQLQIRFKEEGWVE
jgi:hypothetical protein